MDQAKLPGKRNGQGKDIGKLPREPRHLHRRVGIRANEEEALDRKSGGKGGKNSRSNHFKKRRKGCPLIL